MRPSFGNEFTEQDKIFRTFVVRRIVLLRHERRGASELRVAAVERKELYWPLAAEIAVLRQRDPTLRRQECPCYMAPSAVGWFYDRDL